MESLTFELCVATGDPFDRTLGVLCRSGKELVAARSYRVDDAVVIGSVLLAIDRIVLAWARPELGERTTFLDILDGVERMIATPF